MVHPKRGPRLGPQVYRVAVRAACVSVKQSALTAMSPARQLRNSTIRLAIHILADIPYSSFTFVSLTLSRNSVSFLGLAPLPE